MAKLLGIDIGTSGCKVLLIDESGRLLGEASAEYPISSPQPFWSEQAPADWLKGVSQCLESLEERAPDAIGVTGQMHGAVFLDAEGKVIRPAILWNDQRTVAECEEIDLRVGPERVRQITCNPPLTGFQLPKLLWLRKNEPEAYARVRKVLLPKDYLRFVLSGLLATEVSDASGTGILDVGQRAWSNEMFESLGVPIEWFPEVFESDLPSSFTSGDRWLADGIPIVGGGGDQAAAAVGTGAVSPGITSVSLGTSGVVFTSISTPEYDPSGVTHTFCHANRGWHGMGVSLSCGGAVRWFRDTIAKGSYSEMTEVAQSIPAGSEGVRFLPYLTGERCPYVDPFATAEFTGLRLGHGHGNLARAVFEGATAGLASAMDLLEEVGAQRGDVRVTGGGARNPFWVQMVSDFLESPCSTLETDEGPAFGAAILAGVGIGLWSDVAEAGQRVIRLKRQFTPSGEDYRAVRSEFSELYRSQKARRQHEAR